MNGIDFVKKANELRRTCILAAYKTRASHIGSILSMMDIMTYLYYSDQMQLGDKFILSKGHAVLGLYTILRDRDFISDKQFDSYRTDGSELIEHPNYCIDGIDVSTGSLGHGLAISAGLALANPTKKVYCLMGDGECQEGSVWESAIIASRLKIKNLTVIIDCNKYQGFSDPSEQIFPKKQIAKMFSSLDFCVIEIDGHDFKEIKKAFSYAGNSYPKAIIASTIKGKGVSFMENRFEWHYKSPDDEQLRLALEELS